MDEVMSLEDTYLGLQTRIMQIVSSRVRLLNYNRISVWLRRGPYCVDD